MHFFRQWIAVFFWLDYRLWQFLSSPNHNRFSTTHLTSFQLYYAYWFPYLHYSVYRACIIEIMIKEKKKDVSVESATNVNYPRLLFQMIDSPSSRMILLRAPSLKVGRLIWPRASVFRTPKWLLLQIANISRSFISRIVGKLNYLNCIIISLRYFHSFVP